MALAFSAALGLSLVAYLAATGLAVAEALRPDRFPSTPTRIAALTGWALQTAAIGIHCAIVSPHLFTSAPEMVLLASWAAALAYLAAGALPGRWRAPRLLSAVALPLVSALALSAALFPPGKAGAGLATDALRTMTGMERQPAFIAHVLFGFLGYGAFLLVFAAGGLFLVQASALRAKRFGRFFEAMPSLEALEALARGATLAGLGLFTAALALGVFLAYEAGALSTEWLGRTKILLAAATWAAFGVLAVLQRTRAVSARRAALAAVLIFVLVPLTVLVRHFV